MTDQELRARFDDLEQLHRDNQKREKPLRDLSILNLWITTYDERTIMETLLRARMKL